MFRLEVMNELTLKATCDGSGELFTKAGAFIGGESMGGKTYQFEKVLLGPQGNPLGALLGQAARRFTGENMPLMKVKGNGPSVTLYANLGQHVTVIPLPAGQMISVESENILAFYNCDYSVRFLAQGVISQKGLATSTLKGRDATSAVAILTDGNPLVLNNMQSNSYMTADPDAVIAWVGADPGFKLDLSWKNLIGQASGETYMFEWNKPAMVIIQPSERKSGVDISMDGRRTGQGADVQHNPGLGQSMGNAQGDLGGMASQAANMLGGLFGNR